MTKKQSAERSDAITRLREWIKPGDTVYTILDHVSASGMSRAIRVVLPVARPAMSSIHLPAEWKAEVDFIHPNHAVGLALNLRHWKRNGRKLDALVVGGCGMDMGFHLVYNLSSVLYGSGYPCLGREARCPSNYHVNHTSTVRCPSEPFCHWEGARRTIDIGEGQTMETSCWGRDGIECAICNGSGRIPNPEGLERFDLVHTDGYALRHRWL